MIIAAHMTSAKVYRRMTATRRALEIFSVIFALRWAIGVISDRVDGHFPLAWTGMDYRAQSYIPVALLACGLIHAVGIWINGRAWFSPGIRLLAIAGCIAVFTVLTLHGSGSSARVTYSAFVLLYVWSFGGALSDLAFGWRTRHDARDV